VGGAEPADRVGEGRRLTDAGAASPLRDEAVDLLQRLLRVDTVNPPGNETPAARLLGEYLDRNGVRGELYARVPERANLVARLPGRGEGPRLLVLCHTDTVLADPAEWQVDPWSGELRDGHVWGRGALDMKGQVAASAVAVASLAREGLGPAGDVIFAACADEEVGEAPQYGLPWLCEHHPEAVACEYAINEGGGDRLVVEGRILYLCSLAEKRSTPIKLVVYGRSGHAARPGIADNALVKAAGLIQRLAALRPAVQLGPEAAAFAEVVLGELPSAEHALERVRAVSPPAADVLEPALSLTVSATMIEASQKRNVVPGRCQVTLDVRLLPGQTDEDALAEIRDALGPGDYELEPQTGYGGTRSAADPILWHPLVDFVDRVEPGAAVAPACLAGFTDSHWLRERFGTVAYGFFPTRYMDSELAARLIHSADERIDVRDLELGVHFLRHLIRSVGRDPTLE
jgi:acetylornithine deacetylase/succinyl-diaminopimelate desuccinylase-like protein